VARRVECARIKLRRVLEVTLRLELRPLDVRQVA
jgi:hypothetical protein